MPNRANLVHLSDYNAILPRSICRRERLSLVGCTDDGLLRMGCLGELGHSIVARGEADCGTGDLKSWLETCREPYVARMVEDAAAEGRIRVAADLAGAVAESDSTLVCVHVPVVGDGSCDLSDLEAALKELGAAIAAKGSYHSVIICSPVPPGTTMGFAIPTLESATGGELGAAFGVAVWPLPVDAGRAVDDFFAQRRVVVAASDRETSRRVLALFDGFDSELTVTGIAAAELHSFAVNAWKALRRNFESEITELCAALEIQERDDVLPLMDRGRRNWTNALHLAPADLPEPRGSGARLHGFVRALDYFADVLRVPMPVVRGLCKDADPVAARMLTDFRSLRV